MMKRNVGFLFLVSLFALVAVAAAQVVSFVIVRVTSVQLYRTTNPAYNVSFQAPAGLSASYAFTVPNSLGSSGQFLRTNGAGVLDWATSSGAGNVVGPASATNNAIVLFDGTSGTLIKDSLVTLPTGALVGTTDTQTLTNKTLTTPTIASFTNATHTHQNAAGGGTLDAAAIAAGTIGVTRLPVLVGDSGAGGVAGIVPAPAAGDATKFLKGNGTWATVSGTGDVVGPASATNNAIVLFDGTTGKLIKDSLVTLPSGALVGTTDTQTLTNKTLTTPTIGSFANATHTHESSAGGGTLNAAAIAAGTVAVARLPLLVGDSGAGGTAGIVPAPAAGDAAAGKFLKADGTWAVPAGGGGGTTINPTNGVLPYRSNSTTFLDSPLSVTSGRLVNTPAVITTGSTAYLQILTPADTSLTASTEAIGIQLGGNSSAATVTRQFATGALTTQREYLFVAPTYGFVGASTITNAATVAVTGAPVAGTNATLTNSVAMLLQQGGDTASGILRLQHGHTAAGTFTSTPFGIYDSDGTLKLGTRFVSGAGNWHWTAPVAAGKIGYEVGVVAGGSGLGSSDGLNPTIYAGTAPIVFFSGSSGNTIFNQAYQTTWGTSVSSADTGLYRPSAGVLRLTNASTGSGQLLLGSSSDTIAAQLHVVSGSASRVGLRVDSAASATANIFQATNNGTNKFIVDPSGNVGILAASFGTSAAGVLAIGNGTAPTSSPADMAQFYAKDVTTGQSGAFVRDEVGRTTRLTGLIGRLTTTQFDKTNTTLADVTGLSVQVEAGTYYSFVARVYFDADTVGGSKFAISGGATAVAVTYQINQFCNATNALTITSRQTSLGGSAGQAGCTAGYTEIIGYIQVNAAGSLTVQFAQNVANGTSSVLLGSFLQLVQE